LQAVLHTEDIALYGLVYRALKEAGFGVSWKEGQGVSLAGLDRMERGEVVLWATRRGVRAYDLRAFAFLTKKDEPRTLPDGLLGRFGLRLLPGEAGLLLALGRGVDPEPRALAEALGLDRAQARFFLKGLWNKFGLPWGTLLRLARHQVQVAGLQDYRGWPCPPRGQAFPARAGAGGPPG
jgi:hypothetical protein